MKTILNNPNTIDLGVLPSAEVSLTLQDGTVKTINTIKNSDIIGLIKSTSNTLNLDDCRVYCFINKLSIVLGKEEETRIYIGTTFNYGTL